MKIRFSRGIGQMIVASFFFSIMSALVKAGGRRLPAQELVFFRSLLVTLFTLFLIRRRRLPLWGKNHPLLLLRGVVGYLALSAFYFTLTHIPIADAVILQYTSPLFAALFAPFLLKESNTPRELRYFVLAFIGIALIVRPGFSLQALPAFVGVLGACCASMAYILVRLLHRTDHELHIILAFQVVAVVFSGIFSFREFIMPAGMEWLILLGIGLSTTIAQVFMTRSLEQETAARATNASYVAVVFSSLWGILFWKEIPTLPTVLGAAVVIYSVVRLATLQRVIPTPGVR